MREIDEYERAWMDSPERKRREEEFKAHFARIENEKHRPIQSASDYVGLVIAVVIIALSIYCSI